MMKKTYGPAFVRCLIPLTDCPSCVGKGIIQGVFHQFDCVACNASGWVCRSTGDALPLEDLVPQLSMKLRNITAELARAKHAQGGAHEQYEQNNRRGTGASNFTGD